MGNLKGFSFLALVLTLMFCSTINADAQRRYDIKYQEVGGWIGAANYYGDLNTLFGFKGVRPAFGGYFRQTFTPYISLKVGASYGMIEFKDAYTNLPWQQVRNLSFRNNILEFSGSIEFNFLKYIPKDRNYPFSPYLSLGVAIFKHNPKAKYDGQWYKLKDIGTEGQLLSDITGVKEYKTVQPAFPIGMGIKYWMKGKWTFNLEVGYRFTFTDYLDDVHGVFINNNLLAADEVASNLADPSQQILVDPLSQPAGTQRGDSISNDSYLFIGIGVSYAIFKVRCP